MKPGFIYRFKITFPGANAYHKFDNQVFRIAKQHCFPDVAVSGIKINIDPSHSKMFQVVEGFPPYDGAQYSTYFCKNETQITSITDTIRIVYDDSHTREMISAIGNDQPLNSTFYAPFTIDYMAIPANSENQGCTLQINKNLTTEFHLRNKVNGKGVGLDCK